MMNKRAVLNVGGERHEVLWRTLEQIPYSRLGREICSNNISISKKIPFLCRKVGSGFLPWVCYGAGWLLLTNRFKTTKAKASSMLSLLFMADNEFFFDRHPRSFKTILNYYRTGRLHTTDEMWVLILNIERAEENFIGVSLLFLTTSPIGGSRTSGWRVAARTNTWAGWSNTFTYFLGEKNFISIADPQKILI